MKLFIDQRPLGKARPRFNRATGKAIDPQSAEKMNCKWIVSAQMREKGYKTLPKQSLALDLTSYIPIPRSWPKSKRNALHGHPSLCKPDLDNIVKFYCDVLNGIAYEDDAHISKLTALKIYSDKPGVEIVIEPYEKQQESNEIFNAKGIC